MRKLSVLFALAFSLFLVGCNTKSNTRTVQHNNVCILNQGNFTEQNSSIYVYDEDTKEMTPNAFHKANGYRLGATLMSGSFNNYGICYLLCSNPDKIEIVDITTMKSIVQKPVTEGLSNTREILAVGSYFFVTNAGTTSQVQPDGTYIYPDSYVSIYNAANNALISKIPVGADAHGMAFHTKSFTTGTLYVGTRDGVVAIDCSDGQFVKSKDTHKDEQYTGNVRYLCNVNNVIYASVPGKGVYAFDPVDKRTLWRSDVPLDFNGYITADNNNIYTFATTYRPDWTVESSDIYKLSIPSHSYTKVASGDYIYSVGISPMKGNIFYSNANDFTTNSNMSVVSPTGTPVDEQVTGVGTFRYLFFTYFTEEDNTPNPEK